MSTSLNSVRTAMLVAVLALMGVGGGWRATLGDVQTVVAGAPADAVAARGAIVGPAVNVTRRLQNQHENAIAVNPLNPQQVVVLANDEGPSGSVGVVESVSADGGRTWNAQLIATGSGGLGPACCDPTLSWDKHGNLFLGWMRQANPNTFYVELAYSTDGGVTVQPLGPVSDPMPPRAGIARDARGARANAPADQPTVIAGVNSVWVTYANSADGNVYARGAPVTGLGAIGTFNTPQQASGSSPSGNFGDIAIGPSGQVMVVYQKYDNNAGPDRIMVNVDADGLGAGGFGAAVQATTTNIGGARIIPAQANNLGIDAEAGLAWDRSGGAHNGRVYLVYTDAADTVTNNTDIYLRWSDDNGANWSPRKKINDDAGTNSQFLPRIALDQTTGDVAITWYDSRDDTGAGPGSTNGTANDDAELYATYSTDGGITFAPNFRVSPGVSNSWASEPAAGCCRNLGYGDYIGLDFTHGNIWPAWADNSNSTGDNPDGTLHRMDVYAAPVSLLSADVSVTKSAPANVLLGTNLPYAITVTNSGPDPAANATFTDMIPLSTTFASLTQTGGPTFTCTTPAVSSKGMVTCSIASLTSGAVATFSLSVNVMAIGTITNTANVWSIAGDANLNNNVATVTTTASGPARIFLPLVLR